MRDPTKLCQCPEPQKVGTPNTGMYCGKCGWDLPPPGIPLTSKTVTCNCADVPPTMPTYRTEHLAWCPVWLIQHGAVVQSEITEPVTVRACAHTILVSNDPVRGYQRVAPCPYCETDRLRLALERIAYSNNPALSWLEAKECARDALSGAGRAHETAAEPWFYRYQALLAACAQAGFRPEEHDDPTHGGKRVVLVGMPRCSVLGCNERRAPGSYFCATHRASEKAGDPP